MNKIIEKILGEENIKAKASDFQIEINGNKVSITYLPKKHKIIGSGVNDLEDTLRNALWIMDEQLVFD